MNWESFSDFADCRADPTAKNPGFLLWTKIAADEVVNIDPRDIFYQGVLFKREVANQTFKERYFILTRERLYFKTKPDNRIKGFMTTRFVRFMPVPHDADQGPCDFGLRFVRNLKFCDLKARDLKEYNEWVDALTPVMVRTDFHNIFQCTKLLGEGSFAKVYLANRKETGSKYAVKTLSKEVLLSKPKGKQALVNEIEVMYEIDHPNIIRLHEIYESKDSLYLVCEYIPGQTLNAFLCSSTEFLTHAEIRQIVKGILQALFYLEKNGIIHRDIKPDNIMITPLNGAEIQSSNIKICDFGLATFLDVTDPLFTSCGTPGYVAPENLRKKENARSGKISSKSDVFSLGVVLYLLITGESPFKGDSKRKILKSTVTGEIDFKCERIAEQPAHMRDLLRRMLETNPEKRPTAEEALSHAFFKEHETRPSSNMTLLKKSSSLTSVLAEDPTIAKSIDSPTLSIPKSSKLSSSFLHKEKNLNKERRQSNARVGLHLDSVQKLSPVKPKKVGRSVASPPPRVQKLKPHSTQTAGFAELSPTRVAPAACGHSPTKVFAIGENKFKIKTTKEPLSPVRMAESRYKASKHFNVGHSLLSRAISPSVTKSPSPQKSTKLY